MVKLKSWVKTVMIAAVVIAAVIILLYIINTFTGATTASGPLPQMVGAC